MSNGAQELALLFSQLAQALVDFRAKQQANMSTEEFHEIGDDIQRLLDLSNKLVGAAIDETLASIGNAVNNIVQVTKDAQAAVKKIDDVQKAIAVATEALSLGAAILSGNPASILAAAGGVANAIAGGGGGQADPGVGSQGRSEGP